MQPRAILAHRSNGSRGGMKSLSEQKELIGKTIPVSMRETLAALVSLFVAQSRSQQKQGVHIARWSNGEAGENKTC